MGYGRIGEKLAHSFSAAIHSVLADYNYELKELDKSEFDLFFKNRDFKAINVTIPYKQAVIPYLYEIDPLAKKIGAVNTIINNEGKLYGYNTDFYGMKALIVRNGISLKNKTVAIWLADRKENIENISENDAEPIILIMKQELE